jgi:Predicted nucleoside-diphosphate sugar epimerases
MRLPRATVLTFFYLLVVTINTADIFRRSISTSRNNDAAFISSTSILTAVNAFSSFPPQRPSQRLRSVKLSTNDKNGAPTILDPCYYTAAGLFVSKRYSTSMSASSSYPRPCCCSGSVLYASSSSSRNTGDDEDDRNGGIHDESERNDKSSQRQPQGKEEEEEAKRLLEKAKMLREQISNMEQSLGLREDRSTRGNRNEEYIPPSLPLQETQSSGPSPLKNKTVLVVGANGRLGSMVTRYLLRQHPEVKEVLAAVHYVGDATTRGYGRLSYEVGAEDGRGTIGPAWSAEDRDAYFEYADDYMKDYNLGKLRVVEVELLDPQQCRTITDGVDCVIWCATDFDGNRPRAIASLNLAFLFRAVADPTKGRVEIEGLMNILGGLKQSKQDELRKRRLVEGMMDNELQNAGRKGPANFVLVSTAPEALGNFETPFGEFNGLKRQGEKIVKEDFPSLTHAILQMSRYDDNFVEESLTLNYHREVINNGNDPTSSTEMSKRRINRRDAARAAVEALVDENLLDQTVQVWTV